MRLCLFKFFPCPVDYFIASEAQVFILLLVCKRLCRSSQRASFLFLESREVTRVPARERRCECEGWRKLLFLRPSRLCRSLATRNGELVRRLLQWFQFSTKLLVSKGSSTLGSPNLSIAMFLFSHFARLKNGEIITKCHT